MIGLHYVLKLFVMKKWIIAWHYKQKGVILIISLWIFVQEFKKQKPINQNYKDSLTHQRREKKKSSFQELIEIYKQIAEISFIKDLDNIIESSTRSQQ